MGTTRDQETDRPGQRERALWKRFLFVSAPFWISLVAFTGSWWYQKQQEARDRIETQERYAISLAGQGIYGNLDDVSTDLLFVAGEQDFIDFIETGTDKSRKRVEQEWTTFSEIRRRYDQIRFLDEKGLEVIRVNLEKGRSRVLPREQLQPKHLHTYFKETMKLGRGEIYVSRFDLNVEGGLVERPLKPVFRVATLVFDRAGRKRGIVILNYLGAILIDDIKKMPLGAVGKIMMLDSEGYWLLGPRREDEWGFMFDDKKNRSFAHASPDAWRRMSDTQSGQFYDEQGLFTFTTIFSLVGQGRKSAGLHGPGFPTHTVEASVVKCAPSWKLVSWVPQAVIQEQRNKLLWPYIFLLSAVLAATVGSGWAWTVSEKRRMATELRLHDSNVRISTVLATVADGIVAIDHHGIVQTFNQAAARIFGYSPEEVIGSNVKMLMPEPYHSHHDGYIRAYLETGRAHIIGHGREALGLRKSGRTFPIELAINEAATDGLRSFVGVIRDISERKAAETALKESEERYRVPLRAKPGPSHHSRPGHTAFFLCQPCSHRVVWLRQAGTPELETG